MIDLCSDPETLSTMPLISIGGGSNISKFGLNLAFDVVLSKWSNESQIWQTRWKNKWLPCLHSFRILLPVSIMTYV